MRVARLVGLGLVVTGLACSKDSTTYGGGGGGGGGGGQTCAGTAANFTVNAGPTALSFSPQPLTISAGQTVCWQNTGSNSHTVTSNDGTSFNANLGPGTIFSRTFSTAGSFPYHCIPHQASGMTGTITVQ